MAESPPLLAGGSRSEAAAAASSDAAARSLCTSVTREPSSGGGGRSNCGSGGGRQGAEAELPSAGEVGDTAPGAGAGVKTRPTETTRRAETSATFSKEPLRLGAVDSGGRGDCDCTKSARVVAELVEVAMISTPEPLPLEAATPETNARRLDTL